MMQKSKVLKCSDAIKGLLMTVMSSNTGVKYGYFLNSGQLIQTYLHKVLIGP